MTDLTAYAGLPTAELAAEFARMFGTPSPAPAPVLPPAAHPLERAGAGEPSTEDAPCS